MKQAFLIYYDYKKKFDKLSDTELRELLNAIFDYEINGKHPAFQSLALEMAWLFVQDNLDRDRDTYAEKCAKNKENGQKGGAKRGNQNARKQPKTSETSLLILILILIKRRKARTRAAMIF